MVDLSEMKNTPQIGNVFLVPPTPAGKFESVSPLIVYQLFVIEYIILSRKKYNDCSSRNRLPITIFFSRSSRRTIEIFI